MGTANFNLGRNQSFFGLDIGQTSLKVMQIEKKSGKNPKVIGYGSSQPYHSKSIKDGQIVDQKEIAKALNELLENELVGSITTSRVACTFPTAHTFSRPMKLPKMNNDHLKEAIQLEAEQYIPLPPDQLYIDYEVTGQDQENIELLVVAAPKVLVDSYMNFLAAVNLQPVALEPTMSANARLYKLVDPTNGQPIIIIDFGSVAIDIAVLDKTVFANSTLVGGSENITQLVAQALKIPVNDAFVIKNTGDIYYKDQVIDIVPIIKPMLDGLVKEVRRIVRYYNDRAGQGRQIGGMVTTGDWAALNSLNEYLSKELGMPIHALDPWQKIDFGSLEPPNDISRSVYLTVMGEAILSLGETR